MKPAFEERDRRQMRKCKHCGVLTFDEPLCADCFVELNGEHADRKQRRQARKYQHNQQGD